MAFDALSLSVLVKELREKILGAKINKIFQPEKDELHFLLFNNGNFRLVMSANASVNRFASRHILRKIRLPRRPFVCCCASISAAERFAT